MALCEAEAARGVVLPLTDAVALLNVAEGGYAAKLMSEAREHQAAAAKIGVRLTLEQAAREVEDFRWRPQRHDPLDPGGLLRNAEAQGISRDQLGRQARARQAEMRDVGLRYTVLEAVWAVLRDKADERPAASRAGRR